MRIPFANPQPTKIGIRFGDNDFYHTVVPFLKGLHESLCEQGFRLKSLTKETVVKLFNLSAPGLYYLRQNVLNYHTCMHPDYLKIRERQVFFDEEVTEHIRKNDGWDNGEFFWLDVDSGEVASV